MCASLASEGEVVRRAFEAFAAANMNELEDCFAQDAVWHEPGNNIYSGDWVAGGRSEMTCLPS